MFFKVRISLKDRNIFHTHTGGLNHQNPITYVLFFSILELMWPDGMLKPTYSVLFKLLQNVFNCVGKGIVFGWRLTLQSFK